MRLVSDFAAVFLVVTALSFQIAATNKASANALNPSMPNASGQTQGGGTAGTVARQSRAQRVAACMSAAHDKYLDDLGWCADRWPGRSNKSDRASCYAVVQSSYEGDQAACRTIR